MKKNLLYALALATSLVACTDDDYTDWAEAQHNDPETAQSVSFSAAAVSSINFASLAADSVTIFTPTLTAETGATVTYEVTLDGSQTLNANNSGQVDAEELSNAIVSLYGKRPTERTMAGVVVAYVNIDGQVIKTSDDVEVKATLVAPVIETEYYFVGTTNNWTALDKSLKFNHSGADVYDDPEFTIVVQAPVDESGNRVDQWFKIAPLSAYADNSEDTFWASLLGGETNGDTSLTASLVVGGESFMQPATDGATFYSITLNMMDYTITIAPLDFSEFIYVPGNHQSWAPATAPALQSPGYDGVYTGYSYLNGNFKFTKERNWDDGEYNWNDFTTVSDIFYNDDGSNINTTTEGFYQLTADIPSASLTAVATTWSLIGDAIDAAWSVDVNMEYDNTDESWSATTDLSAGQFKFRANAGWDINYGGDIDNLSAGGDNITIAEAGNYTIKLYLTRSTTDAIYCTITKND
ncbi:MAG: SusF/SusE family outer membrane protein [Bacteroides sp.]|nr:SusF/SusE family outer membrane protein [Bacteroides sp.]